MKMKTIKNKNMKEEKKERNEAIDFTLFILGVHLVAAVLGLLLFIA